jgi:flagellar assembly protein FliH
MSNAGTASPWVAPEFSGSSGLMTADKLEAIQSAAYEEAYANGLEEGRKAGQQELTERAEYLNQLVGYLAEPFRQLDEEVEQALVGLALRVAGQVVRRELQTQPQHIVGMVHEALNLLPVAARSVDVHLHPEDAAVVRQVYGETQTEFNWRLVDDPLLNRGDLQVITDTSRIDATLEQRLNDILIGLVGEQRDQDA